MNIIRKELSAAIGLVALAAFTGCQGASLVAESAAPDSHQAASVVGAQTTRRTEAAATRQVRTKTVKVMPVGDSITEGEPGHHTYRYFLSQKYPNLDMVGSSSGVNGGLPLDGNFDQDHEAYAGIRADQITRRLTLAAQTYVPDVALIHLGTNDLVKGQSIESTMADLAMLVDVLRDANPDVKVFIAEIIYCDYKRCSEQDKLNEAISALVPSIDTSRSRVFLVPMGNIGSHDLHDRIHPGNYGSQKMMRNWEAALQSAGVL